MSYTIEVYLQRRPTKEDIELYVSTVASVEVEWSSKGEEYNLVQYIGNNEKQFICSCDGPYEIDCSDVPDGVTEVLALPKWQLTLNLSYPGTSHLRVAKNLGKFLSERCGGLVVDCQRDAIIWPKSKRKRIALTKKKVAASELLLNWYLAADNDPVQVADTIIRIYSEICPDALPTRYGPFEPLQHQFAVQNKETFLKTVEKECSDRRKISQLFWTSRGPFISGSLSKTCVPAGGIDGLERIKVGLSVDHSILHQGKWMQVVRLVFVELARALDAFYAVGYIARRGQTQMWPIPKGDVWLGLPDLPSWLTWYGRAYMPSVQEVLRGFTVESCEQGIFVCYGDEPLEAEQLRLLAPQLPESLVIRREKPPEQLGFLDLVAAGFTDIVINRSGMIVHPKAVKADIIPDL